MRVKINKRHQKLLLLQRIDLISEKQRTIRKKFGRYLFTNFFVNFFISQKEIENKINDEFLKEFNSIKNYLPKNSKNILDIGCGLGVINIYLNDYYSKKPYSFIVGHFGEIGAKELFSLQKNIEKWQGPIRSSLGFHLINVFNRAPMRQMNLDDIFSEVKRDYFDQLRKKNTKTIISNKIIEYEIVDKTENN